MTPLHLNVYDEARRLEDLQDCLCAPMRRGEARRGLACRSRIAGLSNRRTGVGRRPDQIHPAWSHSLRESRRYPWDTPSCSRPTPCCLTWLDEYPGWASDTFKLSCCPLCGRPARAAGSPGVGGPIRAAGSECSPKP